MSSCSRSDPRWVAVPSTAVQLAVAAGRSATGVWPVTSAPRSSTGPLAPSPQVFAAARLGPVAVALIVGSLAGCAASPRSSSASDGGRDVVSGSDGPARSRDATGPVRVGRVASDAGDATLRPVMVSDGAAGDSSVVGDTFQGEAEAPAATATIIGTAPYSLTPTFSATTHDYFIRCSDPSNDVTVQMSAPSGATIAMLQPEVTEPSQLSTVRVSVRVDEAIVVRIQGEAGVDDYWVRCLPRNFPAVAMDRHPEAGAPTPGYYLVGGDLLCPGIGSYAAVLDGNGVPVWYRSVDAGSGGPIDVDNLLPSTISYAPSFVLTTASHSVRFELHDLEAGTTQYVEPSGSPLDAHELRVLANGDFLLLSDPVEHDVDLTGVPGFGPHSDVLGCELQVVNAKGRAVWEWHALDHFDPVVDSTFPETIHVDDETVAEVFHCNAVDVDRHGDYLVSARNMDSVFLVSRETGEVLWKMGGAQYTKDGAPYVAVKNDPLGSFYRPHDARMVGPNRVSMFDDQTGTTNPARAVVYDVDVDAGVATVAWQYLGTKNSDAQGSFRIQPDGTRVIGWGLGGASSRAFTEVDENGNDLLDVQLAGGDGTYRVIKVSLGALDIGLLRAAVTPAQGAAASVVGD